jgi:hypothetical protein
MNPQPPLPSKEIQPGLRSFSSNCSLFFAEELIGLEDDIFGLQPCL